MAIAFDPKTMGTGFPDIDRQHEKLIGNFNHLLDLMNQGRAQEELEPLLDFLAEYAEKHFAHEESCMARHGCPAAAQNERQHREFIDMLLEFSDEVKLRGPSVSLVLKAQRELGQWIRAHIVGTDTELRACAVAEASRA